MNANTDRVRALYRRLQERRLTAGDLIDPKSVIFPDNSRFLASVYGDPKLFTKHFGSFEDTYDIFRVFKDQNSYVIDVGAHWGYSAVAMRHQGCRAKIVSVEAMLPNYEMLLTLKQLEQGQYDCVNRAAGDADALLTFYIPTINRNGITGLSSTGGTLDDYFASHLAGQAEHYKSFMSSSEPEFRLAKFEVQASRLDDILSERGIRSGDVMAIKLDVEGHEGPVLRGSERLLRDARPLLMVEGANRDPQVVAAMVGHGYFHAERRDGKLTPHVAYSRSNDGFWVHPDKAEQYRALGIFEGPVPTPEEAAAPVVPR